MRFTTVLSEDGRDGMAGAEESGREPVDAPGVDVDAIAGVVEESAGDILEGGDKRGEATSQDEGRAAAPAPAPPRSHGFGGETDDIAEVSRRSVVWPRRCTSRALYDIGATSPLRFKERV